MVEMSYVLSPSLYDVRRRSPDVLASLHRFLKTPARMVWADGLERHAIAFEKLDRSGDGEVSRRELEHALGRLTADGGECRCAVCAAWAERPVAIVDLPPCQHRRLERMHRQVAVAVLARARPLSHRGQNGTSVARRGGARGTLVDPGRRSQISGGGFSDVAPAALADGRRAVGGTGVRAVTPDWATFDATFQDVRPDDSTSTI